MRNINLLSRDEIFWCRRYLRGKWYVGNDRKVYFEKDGRVCGNCEEFLVKFGDCRDFSCKGCVKLKSIEGSPEYLNGNFDCSECVSLVSLKGSPKVVRENFNASGCTSMKSLDSDTKKILKSFTCSRSDSLMSLKGSPLYVGDDFYCSKCLSLASFEGSPREIKGDFHCHNCKNIKTIDGLGNVHGNFFVGGDSGLKKEYVVVLEKKELFNEWKESKKKIDEYLNDNSSLFLGCFYELI